MTRSCKQEPFLFNLVFSGGGLPQVFDIFLHGFALISPLYDFSFSPTSFDGWTVLYLTAAWEGIMVFGACQDKNILKNVSCAPTSSTTAPFHYNSVRKICRCITTTTDLA